MEAFSEEGGSGTWRLYIQAIFWYNLNCSVLRSYTAVVCVCVGGWRYFRKLSLWGKDGGCTAWFLVFILIMGTVCRWGGLVQHHKALTAREQWYMMRGQHLLLLYDGSKKNIFKGVPDHYVPRQGWVSPQLKLPHKNDAVYRQLWDRSPR